MYSQRTDIIRGFLSLKNFIAVALAYLILRIGGPDSELFRIGLPVLCTFPYAAAWIEEFKSGYLKLYLIRTSVSRYIWGKCIAVALSGGMVQIFAMLIYQMDRNSKDNPYNYMILFLCGAVFALIAAVLGALSSSKYVTYGISFVIWYLLVMLHDRYFPELYCLYPYEWLKSEHKWILDKGGIWLMLLGFVLMFSVIYYRLLGRKIENG